MNRVQLISEVKDEYARLAAADSQHHFSQTTTNVTPEAYYENLLDMVIDEIDRGTFDNFSSGKGVIEAVANDKRKWLSQYSKGDLTKPL